MIIIKLDSHQPSVNPTDYFPVTPLRHPTFASSTLLFLTWKTLTLAGWLGNILSFLSISLIPGKRLKGNMVHQVNREIDANALFYKGNLN